MSKLPSFPGPGADELQPTGLRTGMSSIYVLVFLSRLDSIKAFYAVIDMEEVQLPHCNSIDDPNLVRSELVPVSPKIGWRLSALR